MSVGLRVRLALLLLLPSVSTGNVLILGRSNFSDAVKDYNKDTFIKFFTPWCGHCKKLAPVWEKLSAVIEKDPRMKTQLKIAEVNADQHKDLASHYGVTSYPTLILFPRMEKRADAPSGVYGKYEGKRELGPLLDFVRTHVKPSKIRRIHAMDLLAHEFYLAAEPAPREEILGRAKRLAENYGGGQKPGQPSPAQDALTIYIKMMEKALKKGPTTFFEDEQDRLNKLIHSDGLSDEKIVSMLDRLKILEGFLTEPEAL